MTAASSPADRSDPNDMVLRGHIGAYRLHATHDPRTTTARERAALLSRFEAEVDPDGVLEPAERRRRAMAARRHTSPDWRCGRLKRGVGHLGPAWQ